MIRAIVLGLFLLALVGSAAEARERKMVVKVQTWSGTEVKGELSCRSGNDFELTDRYGTTFQFSRDTLDMVWRRGNATVPFAFMGAAVGYVCGGIDSKDLTKNEKRVRRFAGVMAGTMVVAFIGHEIPIWRKTSVYDLPTIECGSDQSGGVSLKLGITLHF